MRSPLTKGSLQGNNEQIHKLSFVIISQSKRELRFPRYISSNSMTGISKKNTWMS